MRAVSAIRNSALPVAGHRRFLTPERKVRLQRAQVTPRKRLGRRRPVLEEIREKEHRVRNSARVPVAVAVARRQTSGHRGATEIVEEQGHHVSDIHWPDAVAVTVAALE